MLHRAHIYEFEFQVGQTGDKKRIQSCELQDGTANLETFLFANILWDHQWNGCKEIDAQGIERAYIPVGTEKVYFEDSSTIPNFGVKAMIRAERSPEIKVWLIDTLRNAHTFIPEDAKAKNLKPRKECHATAVKTPSFQVISPLQMAQGLMWHFANVMDPFTLKTYV